MVVVYILEARIIKKSERKTRYVCTLRRHIFISISTETSAWRKMGIFGCGFNGFSQLSTNSDKSSDCKVKELQPLQLDLKHKEKMVQCSLSWSQIAFATDQHRVIIHGFNDDHSTSDTIECRSTVLSLSIDSSQLLIVTKDQDVQQWQKNVCQPIIWKDTPEKCQITQIQTKEMNCIGIKEDGIPIEINQSQKDECVYFTWKPLSYKTKIKLVACGVEHVLMLSELGSILTYGIGSRGQTGLGTTEEISDFPQVIEALEGVKMIAIAAGNWHSAAISEIGDIYTWGWNESGQLGLPCPNLSSDCSISVDKNTEKIDSVLIQALPHLVPLPEVKKEVVAIKVACGARHTAVISGDHHLLTCGWNAYGQLGHGNLASRDSLTYVKNKSMSSNEESVKIMDVYCGGWNTIVATETLELT